MNNAAAEPAVGQSTSANYVYDHGTVWIGDGETSPVEPPIGGLSPDFDDENSGSGWDEWWDLEDPDLGISPLTPAKSETVAAAVSATAPAPAALAVASSEFPRVFEAAIAKETFVPQVVGSLDEGNRVRELGIVFTKRIIPWPLWIAVALIALGIISLSIFFAGRGMHRWLLWFAGICIVLGVIAAFLVRAYYRSLDYSPDPSVIVETLGIPSSEVGSTVRRIAEELPLGMRRITVRGAENSIELIIMIYVKGMLPI